MDTQIIFIYPLFVLVFIVLVLRTKKNYVENYPKPIHPTMPRIIPPTKDQLAGFFAVIKSSELATIERFYPIETKLGTYLEYDGSTYYAITEEEFYMIERLVPVGLLKSMVKLS